MPQLNWYAAHKLVGWKIPVDKVIDLLNDKKLKLSYQQ